MEKLTMQFQAGERYSAEEIQRFLEVGNAGGIRVSLDNGNVRRIALLTVVPTAKLERENPYHDRIEGDVLVYSAGGLRGDQSLAGVNKRLPEQREQCFPIYGFRLNESRRKATSRRWEFLGLLQFLRVYPDNQIDRDRVLRRAWLFELRICSEIPKVDIFDDRRLMEAAVDGFKFDSEREARAEAEEASVDVSKDREIAERVERTRASIFALDPRGFELLVQRALEKAGFVDVSVTRYTQDNGIDVNARVSQAHWALAGLRLQVQAKRWLHTVGRREVAELRGSLDPFAEGTVVTTSFFSRAAVSEAKLAGRQPITLIDGYHFAKIVSENGLLSG